MESWWWWRCFLNCLAPFVPELYILSHTHMRVLVRDSELLYGYLCDFEFFGLFQRYCDMVGYGISKWKVMLKLLPPQTLFHGTSWFWYMIQIMITIYSRGFSWCWRNSHYSCSSLYCQKWRRSYLFCSLRCGAKNFAPLLGSRLRLWHP